MLASGSGLPSYLLSVFDTFLLFLAAGEDELIHVPGLAVYVHLYTPGAVNIFHGCSSLYQFKIIKTVTDNHTVSI